jgi:hypothetical protein
MVLPADYTSGTKPRWSTREPDLRFNQIAGPMQL